MGLFTPGHFMRFFWLDSYAILKRPGVNSLWNIYKSDRSNHFGGGLGRIPDETGQV